MTQTNISETSNTQQQRFNSFTNTTLSKQQKNKRKRKRNSRGSKNGAQREQMQQPCDVGLENNNEIEGGINKGDTEMNEVEMLHRQKQGG
jgi:hypothetical protein